MKKSIRNLIMTIVDCELRISDDRICFANTFYTSLGVERLSGVKPIKHIVNYKIWNADVPNNRIFAHPVFVDEVARFVISLGEEMTQKRECNGLGECNGCEPCGSLSRWFQPLW